MTKYDRMDKVINVAKSAGGFSNTAIVMLGLSISDAICNGVSLFTYITLAFALISTFLYTRCNKDLQMMKLLYYVAEDLETEEKNKKVGNK